MKKDIGLTDLVAIGILAVIVYAVFGNIGLAIMALVMLWKYARKEKA